MSLEASIGIKIHHRTGKPLKNGHNLCSFFSVFEEGRGSDLHYGIGVDFGEFWLNVDGHCSIEFTLDYLGKYFDRLADIG